MAKELSNQAKWRPWKGIVLFVIAFAWLIAGSLTAFFIGTVVMGLTGQFHMTQALLIETDILAFLLTALSWWKHRENIVRLMNGTERKTSLFHKE